MVDQATESRGEHVDEVVAHDGAVRTAEFRADHVDVPLLAGCQRLERGFDAGADPQGATKGAAGTDAHQSHGRETRAAVALLPTRHRPAAAGRLVAGGPGRLIGDLEHAIDHLAERPVASDDYNERVAGDRAGVGELGGMASPLGVANGHFSVQMVDARQKVGYLLAGLPGAAHRVDDEEWRLHGPRLSRFHRRQLASTHHGRREVYALGEGGPLGGSRREEPHEGQVLGPGPVQVSKDHPEGRHLHRLGGDERHRAEVGSVLV